MAHDFFLAKRFYDEALLRLGESSSPSLATPIHLALWRLRVRTQWPTVVAALRPWARRVGLEWALPLPQQVTADAAAKASLPGGSGGEASVGGGSSSPVTSPDAAAAPQQQQPESPPASGGRSKVEEAMERTRLARERRAATESLLSAGRDTLAWAWERLTAFSSWPQRAATAAGEASSALHSATVAVVAGVWGADAAAGITQQDVLVVLITAVVVAGIVMRDIRRQREVAAARARAAAAAPEAPAPPVAAPAGG